LIGALRKEAAQVDPASRFVSVILASREPVAAIQQRIRNLFDTSWPADKLEVIVAVDRAIGELPERGLTSDDARVRVVLADPGGKAGALNAGVRAAQGEVLVFADTFQRFDSDTMPRLVAGLDAGFAATSGCLELPPDFSTVRVYWLFERWLRQQEARIHSAVGVTGACWAMRHELWSPLPEGLLLDDLFTPMRLALHGGRIGFVRNANVVETRMTDPGLEYRRKVRTLTGVLQLCAWMPAVLVPVRNPVFVPFLFHKLARLLTPYLLALIGVWAVVRSLQALGPLSPAIVAAVAMIGAWAGFARGGLGFQIRRVSTEIVLVQAATFVAAVNAMRGRWQVWS
jgi:cellulose synthase/poly-beta-1,6-N-acetylglucosamine synthase-like glycosyltransferase